MPREAIVLDGANKKLANIIAIGKNSSTTYDSKVNSMGLGQIICMMMGLKNM